SDPKARKRYPGARYATGSPVASDRARTGPSTPAATLTLYQLGVSFTGGAIVICCCRSSAALAGVEQANPTPMAIPAIRTKVIASRPLPARPAAAPKPSIQHNAAPPKLPLSRASRPPKPQAARTTDQAAIGTHSPSGER